MIKRIADIEWLVVRNEVEALLTEANMIKQHQPHYNVNLKDDKTFPYIRITKEPYPRVFITREIIRDGSKYFGPYTDVYHLRQSLKAVHKIFPVRSCDYFINDKSTKINIIAMNKDQDKINLIKKKIGYPINFYSNFNNILDSVRILSKSKVLISPDTAMIHLADAAKIKILGLYSADNLNVEKYSPLFSKYKILQSDSLRLKNIETEKVFIEYRKLIME